MAPDAFSGLLIATSPGPGLAPRDCACRRRAKERAGVLSFANDRKYCYDDLAPIIESAAIQARI